MLEKNDSLGIFTVDGVVDFDAGSAALGVPSKVGQKMTFSKEWWDENDGEQQSEQQSEQKNEETS